MSWGTDLWDQFDGISIHSQKSIEFCEKFSHFIKDRCTIETEYAAKLKKLTKSYNLAKKKDEDHEFTCVRGFVSMVNEIHDIAGQHEVIVENLTTRIFNEIQLLVQQLKQDRKKFLQEGVKHVSTLQGQLIQLDKSKKLYEKAFRESEKAQDAFKKADADINMSRADVEKTKNAMVLKQQGCEQCKSEYASELQKTNEAQRQHYETLMPQVFQQLQQMDEMRVNKLRDLLQNCANVEKDILPIVNTCIDGIVKASEMVQAKEDAQTVIDMYKTGFVPPGDIAFEDLSNGSVMGGTNGGSDSHIAQPTGGSSNSVCARPSRSESMKASALNVVGRVKKRNKILGIFSTSKAEECKEDFSHLPPTQQKKKLIQRITSIKATLAKETAERDGMLKMQDVYKQNQALGDPQSLSKQLEENAQKLDKQRQILQKFEAYLAEAESACRNAALDSSFSSNRSSASVREPSSAVSPNAGATSPPSQSSSAAVIATAVQVESNHNKNEHRVSLTADHENFDDIDDDFPVVVGTCKAVYAFDSRSDGSIAMQQGEEFSIIEQDQGDGWTRVRRNNGEEGFVPTTYIECRFFSQS